MHAGYQPLTPIHDLARLLDALEADYSPGTPIRAVVDALTAVVRLWHLHRRRHHDGIPLAQLDRAMSDPLRPLLAAWLHDGDELRLNWPPAPGCHTSRTAPNRGLQTTAATDFRRRPAASTPISSRAASLPVHRAIRSDDRPSAPGLPFPAVW